MIGRFLRHDNELHVSLADNEYPEGRAIYHRVVQMWLRGGRVSVACRFKDGRSIWA